MLNEKNNVVSSAQKVYFCDLGQNVEFENVLGLIKRYCVIKFVPNSLTGHAAVVKYKSEHGVLFDNEIYELKNNTEIALTMLGYILLNFSTRAVVNRFVDSILQIHSENTKERSENV